MNYRALLGSKKAGFPFANSFANILLLIVAAASALGQIGGGGQVGGGGLNQDQQDRLNNLQQNQQGQNQGLSATSPFPPIRETTRPTIFNSPGDVTTSILQQQPVQQFVPLSPEPDIEFQDYVAGSLGYTLPIFGQNLFVNGPSTFAPLNTVSVTPDYMVGPGDELLIRGWGQIEISNLRVFVERDGTIYVPTVGTITVAGIRYDRLGPYLKQAIGRYYKNFDLDVTLGRLRSIQVFMVGQVKRPGTYTISSLSTLVNALFVSGGPSNRGSLRQIQLKRGGQVITTFDFYDLLVKGDKSKDSSLMPGDVIYVPAVGPLVAMSGSVNIPGIYELKDGDTLRDVVSFAGGLASTAAGSHAIIERIDDRQLRKAVDFPLTSDGMGQKLQDGDIIRFLHVSLKFQNAITLRGNVAVPGRYPWREGMRVNDLIPTRESLVTEEYWKQQNLLGLFPENQSYLTEEQRRQVAFLSTQPGQPAAAGQALQTGSGANLGVVPGAGQGLNPELAAAAASSSLAAQQGQPGQTSTLAGRTLEQSVGRVEAQQINQQVLADQIKRSTAEINWQYAVIQRLDPKTLTSHLLPFNLGQAIDGDQIQNLPLQPGDTITIFSQVDMHVPIGHQTKFVRLIGEFTAAGIYQAQAGETLRHLISRVTGLTPQAYLFGSEFTRESIRENLQRQLDSYVNGLESVVSNTVAVTPQDQAALAAQRSQVARMKQLRSSGRIVLEIKPDAHSLDALPDMALEDGDSLFIPFRPATVSVVGAVYNGRAFLYRPGYTVADYLRLAGGATRFGDKKQEFVLRANGATVSRQQHSSLLLNNFATLPLQPGDTIVVPEKVGRGAALQGILSYGQLFSTFSLGAAGLSSVI